MKRYQGQIGTFAFGERTDPRSVSDTCLSNPVIGVYSGGGSSHSWLWFVEIFDRFGFNNVHFLNHNDLGLALVRCFDVLCVSGGDTFRIAEAMGEAGSQNLLAFLRGGGIYIGSCAGAYLPLRSSKRPLNLFNFVDAKIANLATSLPEPRRMKSKFCTPYGCKYVFHPVRDAVELSLSDKAPLSPDTHVVAPLFGGPPFIPSNGCEVLATYHKFTKKTIFLVDEDLASRTVIGRAAAIRKEVGNGIMYLFGPHFEHPFYRKANELLIRIIEWEVNKRRDIGPKAGLEQEEMYFQGRDLVSNLKRELSNARIVAAGLEMLPIHWTIGHKVYEPAKIREFIEGVWRRVPEIEKMENTCVLDKEEDLLKSLPTRICFLLREIKRSIDLRKETLGLAEKLFENLNMLSTAFFNMYFRSKGLGCQGK